MRRVAGWALLAALAACVPTIAKGQAKMSEQQILDGAQDRIERYRKGDATVRVVDRDGRPVTGARVRFEQTRHAFLFGCNAFPLLGYTDPEKEKTYEREFTDLLNYATLGFYWGAYERTSGQTRQAELEKQARWLKQHGVAIKGHPLIWHEVYPGWAPSDPAEAKAKLHERTQQIVSHFAGLIDRWDVVNEATVAEKFDNGEGRWIKQEGAAAAVGEALGWAHAANKKATLLYNDFNLGADFEALAGALVKEKRPVDVFGIQSHMHQGEWPITRVWEVCEGYARFGKPLHFTETTVLSGDHGWMKQGPWPTTPEGEARQADYVEKLYTVLFSHPAVEAIMWWDFMDGGWMGAPAGLVRADLTPKPAYNRLLALIKGRWWSKGDTETDISGNARFRGFAGHYKVTITTSRGDETCEIDISRDHANTVTVTVY